MSSDDINDHWHLRFPTQLGVISWPSNNNTSCYHWHQCINSGLLTSDLVLVSGDASNDDLGFLMQDASRLNNLSGTSNGDLGFLTQGTHWDNRNTSKPIIPRFPLTRHELA